MDSDARVGHKTTDSSFFSYKVEAEIVELKHRHGNDVASSAGLFGMQMQRAMNIFAVKLKRI
jgi:hypothetical protein